MSSAPERTEAPERTDAQRQKEDRDPGRLLVVHRAAPFGDIGVHRSVGGTPRTRFELWDDVSNPDAGGVYT